MLSPETLALLQQMLLSQQIAVSAPDEEIQAVLVAKRELAEALSKAKGAD